MSTKLTVLLNTDSSFLSLVIQCAFKNIAIQPLGRTDSTELLWTDIEFTSTKTDITYFKDQHAVLYPSLLIKNRELYKNSFYPRVFDPTKKIEDQIKELKILIKVYQDFLGRVDTVFSTGIKTVWNYFPENVEEKNSENIEINKTVYFFNIQMGTRKFWEELTLKILESKNFTNCYFVFYYYNSNESLETKYVKEIFENEDIVWAQSSFIRNFLVARDIAIVLAINDIASVEVNLQNILYNLTTGSEKSAGRITRVEFKKFVNDSLEKIYGTEVLKLDFVKIENFHLLYQYNKSKFAKDFTVEIQKLFPADFHIKDYSNNHKIQSEIDKLIPSIRTKDKDDLAKLGAINLVNHFRKTLSSLLKAVIMYHPVVAGNMLVIDDKPDSLKNHVELLNIWFPELKVGYIENFDWKMLFTKTGGEVKNISFFEEQLKAVKFYQSGGTAPSVEELELAKFSYFLVDLDFEGQLIGFDILRRLRIELEANQCSAQIIVLSRFDQPYIIRTAINNGASLYIVKNNFPRLIFKLFELEKKRSSSSMKADSTDTTKQADELSVSHKQYENWHLLNKLEPSKQLELQNTKISGEEYVIENANNSWVSNYQYSPDYQWIRKLPKAELHCHIGSCIHPEILPTTAFEILAAKYKKDKLAYTTDRIVVNPVDKMAKIIFFLLPIAFDPYLDESGVQTLKLSRKFGNRVKEYKQSICKDINRYSQQSIFKIVTDILPIKTKLKIPEEILLSPADTYLEEVLLPHSEFLISPFYIAKECLKDYKVSYDEVMLYFVLLLFIRFNQEPNRVKIKKRFFAFLKQYAIVPKDIRKSFLLSMRDYRSFLNIFLKTISQNIKLHGIFIRECNGNHVPSIKTLQSAHSDKRCLNKYGKGLFNYLRGCEYSGSAHLQTPVSMYLVCKHILEDYMLPDNIRYLELRCAADGYTKFGFFETPKEALDMLTTIFTRLRADLNATTMSKFTCCVNIIITAKRHKSQNQFTSNVELVLDSIKERKKEEAITDIYKSDSKVVSFDIAGLEAGHRPMQYAAQVLPLLKKCFPMTIHAGEEDDSDAIWEAVYMLNSQRLGHALTLRENIQLLDYVKERHVTVELCPVSNLLTNNRTPYRPLGPGHSDAAKDSAYPLRFFLDKNLDVTINTDNPAISDTTLTQEFLVGARFADDLTKWEILRLIKNSFKGAAIPKDEKRALMNAIDAELFEILSDEG